MILNKPDWSPTTSEALASRGNSRATAEIVSSYVGFQQSPVRLAVTEYRDTLTSTEAFSHPAPTIACPRFRSQER
jgi:hypothetical protein